MFQSFIFRIFRVLLSLMRLGLRARSHAVALTAHRIGQVPTSLVSKALPVP